MDSIPLFGTMAALLTRSVLAAQPLNSSLASDGLELFEPIIASLAAEGTEPLNVSFVNDCTAAIEVHRFAQEGSELEYVGTVRISEAMRLETFEGTTFVLKEADKTLGQTKVLANVQGPGAIIILAPDELGQLQVDVEGGVFAEVMGLQPHLFMCEECLHSGWDYCTRSNRCWPRGLTQCDGPDDHVTGDEDFAFQVGATFLECPSDADLLDGEYTRVHGHISHNVTTLFQDEMTLRDGRSKCTATLECQGFTVEHDPSSDDVPVLIFFKSAADVIHSSWVSYIFVKRADARTRTMHVPKALLVQHGFLSSQTFKSEPVPNEKDVYSGNVKNIVGKTFFSTVQNSSMDVLVNCFAPWCGWCQKFKPTYAGIAKGLRHVKTLEFAQIDATRNSVGDFEIEAYPTLLLFRAGPNKSEVLSYPGPRTPDKIKAWLHAYVTHAFSDYPPLGVKSSDSDSEGLLGNENDL